MKQSKRSDEKSTLQSCRYIVNSWLVIANQEKTCRRYYDNIKSDYDCYFIDTADPLYYGTLSEKRCGKRTPDASGGFKAPHDLRDSPPCDITCPRNSLRKQPGDDERKAGMALPVDSSDFLGVQRQDEDQKLDQNPQSTFSIALPSDCGTYCTCHCSIKATVGNGKGSG